VEAQGCSGHPQLPTAHASDQRADNRKAGHAHPCRSHRRADDEPFARSMAAGHGRELITLRSVSTPAAKPPEGSDAPRSSRRPAVWLVTIVSVWLVSGCGGSATSGPTHVQFVSQANAICAKAVNAGQKLHQPKSRSELLPFIERARPIVARVVSELKDVKAPSNARAAYDRFLATTAQEVRSLGELTVALRAHDVARERAAVGGLSSNSANEQAQALGLPECARTVTQRGAP
jgi:hypothetical protein